MWKVEPVDQKSVTLYVFKKEKNTLGPFQINYEGQKLLIV